MVRSLAEWVEAIAEGGSGWCDEASFARIMAIVTAAERRRQAASKVANTADGTTQHRFWLNAYERAERDEDAALDVLAAHVTQRGDTPDDGLNADRSRDNAEEES